MKKALLTTKVGMTQIFNADGALVPVTVLQAAPNVVTQVKTVDALSRLEMPAGVYIDIKMKNK